MKERLAGAFVLLMIAAAGVPGRAQSPESFRAMGDSAFRSLGDVRLGYFGLNPASVAEFDQYVKERAVFAANVAKAAGPSARLVLELDLKAALNRHLQSRLKYSLAGKDVWISGIFDRNQNAYASVLVDGQDPKFFEVKGLLDKEQQLPIGTGNYKLYLVPNVFNKMKSEIVLENVSNEDEQVRVSLKKLLDAVSAAGTEVKLTDQAYRTFYFDNVKAGKQDKTLQTLAFALTEANGDFKIFLVPAELVPTDTVAVFKMYKDKRVGLKRVEQTLKVFEL